MISAPVHRFSVTLPARSRAKLPPVQHVKRFADANTYQAYIRTWSEAGYVIQFDGPHSARVVGAGE